MMRRNLILNASKSYTFKISVTINWIRTLLSCAIFFLTEQQIRYDEGSSVAVSFSHFSLFFSKYSYFLLYVYMHVYPAIFFLVSLVLQGSRLVRQRYLLECQRFNIKATLGTDVTVNLLASQVLCSTSRSEHILKDRGIEKKVKLCARRKSDGLKVSKNIDFHRTQYQFNLIKRRK